MKVVADRVCQEEIMKAYHEGIGSLQEAGMLAGHFGRNKTGAMAVVRWFFPHIFRCVTYIKYNQIKNQIL